MEDFKPFELTPAHKTLLKKIWEIDSKIRDVGFASISHADYMFYRKHISVMIQYYSLQHTYWERIAIKEFMNDQHHI